MLLEYPNYSTEINRINTDLRVQQLLYNEAIIKDLKLSVKKEIRLRIKELQTQLAAQQIINLGLEYSRQ